MSNQQVVAVLFGVFLGGLALVCLAIIALGQHSTGAFVVASYALAFTVSVLIAAAVLSALIVVSAQPSSNVVIAWLGSVGAGVIFFLVDAALIGGTVNGGDATLYGTIVIAAIVFIIAVAKGIYSAIVKRV